MTNAIAPNRLALIAVRSILDAARPFELSVHGTQVSCNIERGNGESWPGEVRGVSQTTDGPWPHGVTVRCSWTGGSCALRVACEVARYHWSDGEVSIAVSLADRSQQLVWLALGRSLEGDVTIVPVQANASIAKREETLSKDTQRRLNEAIATILSSSGLPVVTRSKAQMFEIQVPGAEVTPSPDVAFRRLIHLALIKMDFIDQDARAKDRGAPLIDVGALVGPVETLDRTTSAGEQASSRQYWAGGFQWGDASQLDRFVKNNTWQSGWTDADAAKNAAARVTMKRLREVRVGDWFAIKGYGGNHDLAIHYVGEVLAVDVAERTVNLRRLPGVKLFKGEAPRGAGAGSWRDTLVPVTRADVIEQVFGVATDSVAPPPQEEEETQGGRAVGLPLNLILYGPPGTGKTFHLQNDLMPRFRRPPAQATEWDILTDEVADLTYFETIVVALTALGGRASVTQLMEHPLIKAKSQANAPKNIRQILWGTLGQHAVESSETVKMKRRLGELVFDKTKDGRWFLAAELPLELAELVARTRRPKPLAQPVNDYELVTFHQAYSYEDFIEGIRPRLVEVDEGDEAAAPATGELIPHPAEGLSKVSVADRVPWGPKERGAFIKEWYDRGLATPEGGWSEYDIHHIRPREFGGTNSFDNLVPVERATHQTQFNPWWRDY